MAKTKFIWINDVPIGYKINLNYLPCFKSLLEYYRKTGNKAQEEKLYNMLKHILDSSKEFLDDESYKYYYDEIKR